MIEEFSEHIPKALWERSGKAFHSGRLAFSGRRDLYTPGRAPFQLEMQALLGRVGLDPREMPASDLIFLRSAQADRIASPAELMELCWPFHRAVIERLGVRVVLSLYKPAAGFVRMKTDAYPMPVDRVFQQSRSAKRKYRRECFAAPGSLRIVQITRPTGAPWTENACALTKRALAG